MTTELNCRKTCLSDHNCPSCPFAPRELAAALEKNGVKGVVVRKNQAFSKRVDPDGSGDVLVATAVKGYLAM